MAKLIIENDIVLNDGDIIRFDLYAPLKYGYFILRNFEYTQVKPEENVNTMTWNVWLYPLAITSDDSNKKEVELKILNSEINHLCAAQKSFAPPFHPSGRKNKFGWKVIGNKKLGESELVHPWERGNNGLAQLYRREQWDDFNPEWWYAFQIEDSRYSFGAPIYDMLFIDYKRIKHLSIQGWRGPDLLKYYVTFMFMRYYNLNISDHFKVEELKKDPSDYATYLTALNSVLYKDVPKPYWNIILPE